MLDSADMLALLGSMTRRMACIYPCMTIYQTKRGYWVLVANGERIDSARAMGALIEVYPGAKVIL